MPIPQRTTAASDTWLTPPWILKPLGRFDLDPAASIENPGWTGAARQYTETDDGLSQTWEGRVWLNPPYGRGIEKWLQKLTEHGDGIALVFARTDTKTWQDWIFPHAHGAHFLRGRIKFHTPNGTLGSHPAPAPAALIAYGKQNATALAAANLPGHYLQIRRD